MKITLRQAYTTLGVTHGASEDEARTAYRKLALQFHPDKNPHAEATAKFQEISAAYKKICDFHKHGGNQRGSFFFDEEDGDDFDANVGDFGDDFNFDGMEFDDLEPTFEEMLMMFEMMFGPPMPSAGKINKTKKKKKKDTAKETNPMANHSNSGGGGAAAAPPTAEPPAKGGVPLGSTTTVRMSKSRRRKAPLGKQRGRGGCSGVDDPLAGFMDPEMMMFEQFMGMSMNDPDLTGMDGDLMEEMMHLFAGASDDDLFDLGGGRGPRKPKGKAKTKPKKAATTNTTRVETSLEEEVEEVSDWEDVNEDDQTACSEAKPEPPHLGNQGDDPVAIDSRVYVHGKLLGTVKFFGTVHYAKGDFIGVALDDPDGKNDGTLKGVTYFKCAPRHGVMVRPQDVTAAPSIN